MIPVILVIALSIILATSDRPKTDQEMDSIYDSNEKSIYDIKPGDHTRHNH